MEKFIFKKVFNLELQSAIKVNWSKNYIQCIHLPGIKIHENRRIEYIKLNSVEIKMWKCIIDKEVFKIGKCPKCEKLYYARRNENG